MPERESIRSLAAHQATMVLFLSTALAGKLQGDLLAGGYAPGSAAPLPAPTKYTMIASR